MAATTRRTTPRAADQVRSAPFIFTGRVVQPGGSTVREIAPRTDLAVVQVDNVFRAPVQLGDLKGKRLTIQLPAARPMDKGARALFYATSWIYSDGIGVVEVGRASVPRDPAAMLADVARAELSIEDEKIQARLRRADIVVTGRVERVNAVETERTSLTSEHDPVWCIADILVDRVEKGKRGENRLAIAFPASLDEYWIDVPKLQPGQRGVFILHREVETKRARMRPPAPAILDALDFHLPAQTERVRALLKLASRGT